MFTGVMEYEVLEKVNETTRYLGIIRQTKWCPLHAASWMVELQVGESIYDQKPPNPKKIDTKGFLTDSGRICHVK